MDRRMQGIGVAVVCGTSLCAAIGSGTRPSFESAQAHPPIGLLHGQWPFDPPPVQKPAALALPEGPVVSKVMPSLPTQEGLRFQWRREPFVKGSEGYDRQVGLPASPLPTATFDTFPAAYDPAIAVGHKYILVISDHRIAFYGRDGKLLPSKHGEKTDMSATEFFRAFWEPTRPDGKPNPSNINAHLGYPAGTLTVDPTKDPKGQLGGVEEWYDSRCFYDPAYRRFFFLSAARNHLWFNDEKSNPGGKYDACVRRYFAFAVSRTEDPRDGFDQWMTTESNYADWPRMAVANGLLTVAHNSPQAGKPFAYVFRERDLIANKPTPASWQYFAADFPGSAKVLPVTQWGPSGGVTYFTGVTKPDWNPIKVYGLTEGGSPMLSAEIPLATPMGYHIDNPKYRGGRLYFCCNVSSAKDTYQVRVTRVGIGFRGSRLTAETRPSHGFLDIVFGNRDSGDARGDLISYEKPALAVNKDADIAVIFGRVGVATALPLFPEARYVIVDHGASQTRPSTLIRKGEFLPEGEKKTPAQVLDLANATVDPVDDKTFWLCHAYANKAKNTYMMVVAKVKP
jgi:hypothetical protein